jgi:hypothetical protein
VSKYRVFGNRVLVSIITPLAPPQPGLSHMPYPAGVAVAVPDDKSGWSSPFGKGRAECIGESDAAVASLSDALEHSVIDAEYCDEPPKEGFDKFAGQLIELYKKSGLFSSQSSPLPPVSIGDVVIFRLYEASVLRSGIVAVVGEKDFQETAK